MTTRGSSKGAAAISVIANVIAGLLVLWLILYLLDANPANGFVDFIHDVASWFAGWGIGMFQIDDNRTQEVADYGIPAAVYAIVGNVLARFARRF